jgi:hypothetical protein
MIRGGAATIAEDGVDADAAVAVVAEVGVEVGADANVAVEVGAELGVEVDADADVAVEVVADVGVGVEVDADVGVGAGVGAGVEENEEIVSAEACGASVVPAAAGVPVALVGARGTAAGVPIDELLNVEGAPVAGTAAMVAVGVAAPVAAPVAAAFATRVADGVVVGGGKSMLLTSTKAVPLRSISSLAAAV